MLQFARTLGNPHYGHLIKKMLDEITKIDLGVGLGGRYSVMVIKLVLVMGIQGVCASSLATLNHRSSSARMLAIKADVEADVFDKAVQKLVPKSARSAFLFATLSHTCTT